MSDLVFDKRTEGFTLSQKSRDILQRYAKAHNIKEKTKTLEALLEEYDAVANPPTSAAGSGSQQAAAPGECKDGLHCEPVTVLAPKSTANLDSRKLTMQEKSDMMLDVWRRKRQIDIEARVELAERLARIHRENSPYHGSQSSRIEITSKGGSVIVVDKPKIKWLSDADLREMREAFFPSIPNAN